MEEIQELTGTLDLIAERMDLGDYISIYLSNADYTFVSVIIRLLQCVKCNYTFVSVFMFVTM